MALKVLLASAIFSISAIASAAQTSKYPLKNVDLSYNPLTNKIYATGTLLNGIILTNSLSSVSVNTDLTGKFEVDQNGRIRLAMKHSGAFLVGKTTKTNAVVLDVPYTAYQISERYDAIEKSFGLADVDYITLDIEL